MTYLALWLLALGAGDLLRPGAELTGRRPWWWPLLASVPVLLLGWPLLGLGAGPRLVSLPLMLLALVAWTRTSVTAVAAGGRTRYDQAPALSRRARRSRVAALSALLVAVAVGFAVAGVDPPVAGPVATWWHGLGLPRLAAVPPTRAVMVLAAMLVQVGTANVVVRLVLDAAGAHSEPGVLRGGRWLGPMERVFVVGLALAGQWTAASVVVAAKGILRFPELQAQRAQGQRIDAVTEYFLVGSFTSWIVALGAAVLAL
ncbi:hypothetical protein [Arsenicicoccus sp. oral taxon 190]|uniref:hypothetical protein n=1 Tax=Arsenicicoccus sp. oral taxon 190 TaxID=1658671 RepID=UPI00067A129D|nr:hypothetical protein [Arsenicicoccus sp. oral taxon 190]AKT50346.1 hypothetical protein ADJ73_01680 [Arsenicicoccus sp. oral taxon 190]